MHRNFWATLDHSSGLFVTPELLAQFRTPRGGAAGVLWCLPVDLGCPSSGTRKPQRGHIVSVSRLNTMKAYTLHLVGVVDQLRRAGHSVKLTLYGDGPLEARIRQEIERLNLTGHVTLKGRIPHCDFRQAVADAWVFVGMGTALLEAASAGVPCVIAVAHDQDGRSVGPLHALRPGSIGDLGADAPPSTIEAEPQRVLALDADSYQQECRRCLAHAQAPDVDQQMEAFVSLSDEAKPATRHPLLEVAFRFYAWVARPRLSTLSPR